MKTETYTTGQAAQDAKITAAQNAANKANATIGDWDAQHPGKTIAQAVTDVSGDIPDVSGFVTKTTYNQEQAAQDAKITVAQNAANKANATIGDWETDHPGQTISQCATSVENEIAAVGTKADANAANIGDWNAEHPGTTISQECTRLNGAIPDVSGFVTETTYNQGQAAQDAKIAEAKTAADKAAASIDNFSVPVNLDLNHGASPNSVVQTTSDYFTVTVEIANPAYSSDRTNYTLIANNIETNYVGYRIYFITFSNLVDPPKIVSGTFAEPPTLRMNENGYTVYGNLKVKGTKPDGIILAVYYRGRIAGQITYKVK